MKIKLFGIPIIEYQPHEQQLVNEIIPPALQVQNHAPSARPKAGTETRHVASRFLSDDIPNQKSLADLFIDPASSLPAHKSRGKMRLDIDAALDLFGITDPNDLWNHEFKRGSAGSRLRAALGAIGYGPDRNPKPSAAKSATLTEIQLADIENLPADILPRRPNGKLDVEAGIKLLNITDPAELWRRKTKYGTALHLIKQAIGTNQRRMAEINKQLAKGGK